MSRDHHQRVMQVFKGALDLGHAARRDYLDQACGGDAELRAQVESLLRHDAAEVGALAMSAVDIGPDLMDAVAASSFRATDVSPPRLPARIGAYRPVRVIGQGGMGIVYEAEQDAPRRTVALKMIRGGAMSRQHLRRFRLEAELLGRLQHPGIAKIYEAGTIAVGAGDLPYFAMELIDGQPITRYAAAAKLDARTRLDVFARVCDAVQHAHQKSVVHRDLKPDNILVDGHGQPRILDFGVARATDADVQVTTLQTDAGTLIGTLPYMSPEQVVGRPEEVDTRSDVYALGVILFELLSERLPHDLRGRSIVEAARIIREDEPTRLGSIATSCRGDLDAVVRKALEKEPQRRYQSAAELAADVRRYLRSEPISARPPTTLYQLRRFARRHRALVAGTAVAFIALATGLVTAVMFAMEARGRATEAQWATYRAQMQRSTEALRRNDVFTALEAVNAAPERLSGWERKHIRSRLAPVLFRLDAAAAAWGAPRWRANEGPRVPRTEAGAVAVVDVLDNRAVAEFAADDALFAPHISADGSRVAATELARATVHVWEMDGSIHRAFSLSDADLPMPNEDFRAADVISLDRAGSRVACRALRGNEPAIVVIDVATGEAIFTLGGDRKDGSWLSPDGTRLAAAHGGLLVVIDLATGATLARRDVGGEIWSIRWSEDGQFIAALSAVRRTVHVCRAADLAILLATPPETTEPSDVAFASDGRTIAIARHVLVEIWDLQTRTLVAAAPGEFSRVAFEPGGSRLIASSPHAIQIIDAAAANPPSFADSAFLYLAAFSPDGSLLATLGFSGTLCLWDLIDNKLAGTIATEGPIAVSLSFLDDGSRVVASTRGGGKPETAQAWDVTTLAPCAATADGWRMRANACAVTGVKGVGFCISADGTRAVGGYAPYYYGVGRTVLMDVATGRELLVIPQAADVTAISRDNAMLATDGPGGAVLWDGRSGKQLRTFAGPAGDSILGLAFTPDGKRLVGGGRGGAIYFWDVACGDLICSLHEHNDYVHHVLFSDDGTRLATASGDGTARIFDAMSLAERERERIATRQRRARMLQIVGSWRDSGCEATAVIDRLRTDRSLTAADRRILCSSLSISGP